MTKKRDMLTATFQNPNAAENAYQWLLNHGYRQSEVNVIMSGQTRDSLKHHPGTEHIRAGSKMAEGAAAGGAIGTAVGATLGAIAAIGTAVALPGLGIVIAGPLAAALAGGGAGAVAGGTLGGLIGLGISESNVKAYERVLKNGGVILGVTPRSNEDADTIKAYFQDLKADNIVCASL